MRAIILTAITFAGSAPLASAQSFDCGKAQSVVEKMICADASLRELDEHLGRYYAAGRTVLEGAASCLQTDQAQWLKTTRGACRDTACLKVAYLNRLAELDPLQPGATAITNIELPAEAPALVWVIGPAADKVAAPANARVSAFEGSGAILNEVSRGDGFMLQTSDEKIPLVLLTFLEGKTGDHLAALAKAKNTKYRARGYLAFDGKRRFFEPSRCTFIHRVPPIDPGLQDMEESGRASSRKPRPLATPATNLRRTEVIVVCIRSNEAWQSVAVGGEVASTSRTTLYRLPPDVSNSRWWKAA